MDKSRKKNTEKVRETSKPVISSTDPLGMYTGNPDEDDNQPIQDGDDL
jgi:hypothetical protein